MVPFMPFASKACWRRRGPFSFGRAGAVKMPRDRSIDINDSIDFMVAELKVGRESHA